MKKLLLIGCSALMMYSSHSQVNLTYSSSTYSYLSGGTQLFKDTVWDEMTYDNPTHDFIIPLGFNFTLNGNTSDTLYLWDQNILSNDMEFVYGHYLDMIDKGVGTALSKSPIYILREGSAPNRIVKIEWRNAGFYDELDQNSTLNDSSTLQYWFYENGNKFEIHFGPSSIANTLPAYIQFLGFGIYGTNSNVTIVSEGNSASPTLQTDPVVAVGLDDYPAAGKVYTYAPGVASTAKMEATVIKNLYQAGNVIYTKNNQLTECLLYDFSGKQAVKYSFKDGKIDLNNLSAGTYLAKSGTEILKVIITY